MGRAVQVPVEVRMWSYELRARMYCRMERMMRRQSTGQRAYELAPCSTAVTSATTTAAANATTSSRSAVR